MQNAGDSYPPYLSASSVVAGGTVILSYRLSNWGPGDAGASVTGIYRSTDSTIATGDWLATTDNNAAFSGVSGRWETATINTSGWTPGTYYIGAIADYANAIAEGNENESNNPSSGVMLTVTVVPPANPDLVANSVSVSNTTPSAGGTVTVNYTIANIGTGSAVDTTAGIYLSTDASINTSDTRLATNVSYTSNGPGSSDSESQSITLPGSLAPGTYYIGVIADYNGIQAEARESNNASAGVAITIRSPGLFTNGDDIVTMSAPGTAHALDGNDRVTGTAGTDYIYGDAGNDTLNGGAGADVLTGGLGIDTLDYATSAAAVRVYLFNGFAGGAAAGDVFSGFENVTGGAGSDYLAGNGLANALTGNGGNDTLGGGGGNDILNGGVGNDVLYGGVGADQLTGGTGLDAFVFNWRLGGGNIDRIVDFSVIDDTIRLENAIFTGLANGVLAASAFTANLTGFATDALDRIILETDTGNLFFDADGTGAGARVQFAVLAANLALTNADFLVI